MLDLEDHFTSYHFIPLFWTSFEAFVKRTSHGSADHLYVNEDEHEGGTLYEPDEPISGCNKQVICINTVGQTLNLEVFI